MKTEILPALRKPRYREVLTIPMIVLAAYILLALAAPVIAPQNPYDPLQIYGWEASSSPGTPGTGGYLYLLGTDGLGRDILSTIVYGLRISLVVSVTSA